MTLAIVAMAYRSPEGILPSCPSSPTSNNREANGYIDKEKSAPLVFTGFVAMYDPPCKSVSDDIALLQGSGMQVIMIVSDAEETVQSVCGCMKSRQARILSYITNRSFST